jgi:GNAT superfamily N-acetyltransferase
MSLDIRPMSRGDLDVALGWAHDEGWNPGLDDAAPFFAQDPTGFLMGWLGNVRIGCVSVVKYGTEFAFLGLYIVLPAFRGKGYGKAIWDAGISSAAGRIIGLDGVVAQQDNYRRSGFALAHKSARWGGTPQGHITRHAHVRPIAPHDAAALAAYDRAHVAADRSPFLATWLTQSPTRQTQGYFEEGRLRGFGSIRRAVSGWKVGPLFADTPAIAEALFSTLLATSNADQVYIDVPEPNIDAREMVNRRGLTPAFETARMYLGPAPNLPLNSIYGITTLELG